MVAADVVVGKAHFRAVMGPGTVPVPFKEMLAVRVSRLNDCDY